MTLKHHRDPDQVVIGGLLMVNMVVEEGDGDASLILAKTCFAKFINISVAMWKNLHVVMDSACPWIRGFHHAHSHNHYRLCHLAFAITVVVVVIVSERQSKDNDNGEMQPQCGN